MAADALKALLTTWKARGADCAWDDLYRGGLRDCARDLEAALLALGERQETAEPPQTATENVSGAELTAKEWKAKFHLLVCDIDDALNGIALRQGANYSAERIVAQRLAAHREGPATADLKGLLIDRDAILRDELRVYLDTFHISGDNIGDIRRSLFVPWESQWNGWVRDETADREGRPPAAEKCSGCEQGLPVLMLDDDGVRIDISGKPGKPSHAVEDSWWLCTVAASRAELIEENKRLRDLIPTCAECGEVILDNSDIRCSECVAGHAPASETPTEKPE